MRTLQALAAGLAVGLVVIEALLAGMRVFMPELSLPVFSGAGDHPEVPTGHSLLAIGAAWLVGSILAGAMACAVGRTRITGWMTGLLLGVPVVLIVALADLPVALAASGALPLAGAIAGAGAASRTLGPAPAT